MKLLMIAPPNYSICIDGRYNFNVNFPLGLAYVSAIAERDGHEVKALDCVAEGWKTKEDLGDGRGRIGISHEDLIDRIVEYNPDVVAISNLFLVQQDAAFEAARAAKKASKKLGREIKVVIGGAQATSRPRETMGCEAIDIVVVGEGEEIFSKLLGALDRNEDYSEHVGLAYRKSDGEIVVNPRSDFIIDLDAIPFPARHLFDMELYFNHTSSHGDRKYPRYASIVTSRGCPLKCTFCNVHDLSGRRFRYRSPESVLKELNHLKDEYGIQEILFEDDNLTAHKRRATAIFDMMIKEKLDFEWDTPNGVAIFSLNEEMLDKMKASGCYRINIAIEAADKDVLKNIIKKPVNLEKAVALINHANSIDMIVQSFFIVGLPGTTITQMKKNFKFMRKHRMFGGNTAIFTPYPGTELWRVCEENDYFVKGFDSRYATPYQCFIQTPEFTPQQVENLVKFELLKNTLMCYLFHPLSIPKAIRQGSLVPFLKRVWGVIKLKAANTFAMIKENKTNTRLV